MAAFASDRRSGWVRFLVVLLCALFLFATLGAPAVRAEALTVGFFTAAAVLSAATAALGFKLSNSAEGKATLAKMVKDFKVSATAVGLVLVGSKINGLIDGVDYIKMQVKAGKTYLDERIVAWVQQWLGVNGVYDTVVSGTYNPNVQDIYDVISSSNYNYVDYVLSGVNNIVTHYNLNLSGYVCAVYATNSEVILSVDINYTLKYTSLNFTKSKFYGKDVYRSYPECLYKSYVFNPSNDTYMSRTSNSIFGSTYINDNFYGLWLLPSYFYNVNTYQDDNWFMCSNYTNVHNNNTGLSGSDTIGKDVVDKSLDDILTGLKEWAPDWWDAGADSSTNAAIGAKDLPLNMGSDVKTVTGNPALDVDQPLIYTPWFEETLDNLRSGETAGTVTNTATSAAETAEKAEAAQGTVEDAQGVVQSIISWGLDYISPDKGLFSRFPLCIPYDAYLLVTAAFGVDAQDLGDIVGQSPGELSAQVDDGVAVQSDFVPVISVKHDWTQDGVTTPVEVTIDFRPYDGIINMIRTLVSVYVIAELIASEYKRIRGS